MREEELKEYYDILCNGDYPNFLDRYSNVKEMNRLKEVGQFCGCDYTRLHNIKYWYSRYDHSIAVALMTWNFTHDKEQTIVALYHDLGTPAFAHAIDFLLGDSINQSSSEKDIYEIVNDSDDIKILLEEDNISADIFKDIKKYPVIKNDIPRLCADRLDGILPTNLIWLQTWDIDTVRDVYSDMSVFVVDGELEISNKSIDKCELFYEGIYNYSIALQSNEDKFTLQCISDFLKKIVKEGIINIEQLYLLSEREILEILKDYYKESWKIFCDANKLIRTDEPSDEYYCANIDAKKRYVLPNVNINNNNYRINEISKKSEEKVLQFLNYNDSKYSYIEGLKKF